MTTVIVNDSQECKFDKLERGDKFYPRCSTTLYMKTSEITCRKFSFDDELEATVYNAVDLISGIPCFIQDNTLIIPVDTVIHTNYRFN